MRFTQKEASRLASMAGRGQNVAEDLRNRERINEGIRIVQPNFGESLFIYMMRTIAPDLLALHPVHDVEVFPDPSDNRRVDFSFLPTPLVIEIQGGVHKVEAKMHNDWNKVNALQLAGCMVLQFTPDQIRDEPTIAADMVRQGLVMQAGRSCALVHGMKKGDDY